MPGIDDIGRIKETLDNIRNNIGTKPRRIFYVDSTNGNNNYDGRSPTRPVHSINTAIGLAGHGDAIHIARDTYDEVISIPAGKNGLQIICEPGVYIVNTVPGTVVAIASDAVYWEGGIIETNGQIGMAVNGNWFVGKNIRVYNCTVGFDLNSAHPLLINCFANDIATTGFDISEDSGVYIDCTCHGLAASRGFYFSHTNAHFNILLRCATLGCTAAGYECVAGADENLFDHCSQSVLCAGPTDAGTNNTWVPIDGLLAPAEAAGPFSYLDAGGEQTVYEDATTDMRKISLDLDLNAMTQNGTVRLYRKTDAATYRIWIQEPFNVGGAEKVFSRDNIVTNQHFKVTYQEAADEGAARSIPYNIITEPMEV
jgi:hypothetical protein